MLIDLRPHVDAADERSVRARLRAAWRYVNEVALLRALLLAEGFALIFFAADASIEVPYAKATLHAGDGGYGLILTVWGLGVGLGSLAFARAVRRPLGMMLTAGTTAVGLAYVGFAVAPSLAVACVAALVGGLGNGVQWASLLSAVQQLTPQHLHGRMMGAVESINALCPGLGLLLGGVLVALSSPRTAFLVVGLGATATTVAFIRLGVRSGLQPAVQSGNQAPSGDVSRDGCASQPARASADPEESRAVGNGPSGARRARLAGPRHLKCHAELVVKYDRPRDARAEAQETTVLARPVPAVRGRSWRGRLGFTQPGMASASADGAPARGGPAGRAARVRDKRAAPLGIARRARARHGPARPCTSRRRSA